ncbi:glutathione S-transferase family protein [Rhodanobacter lindaniclasticus]
MKLYSFSGSCALGAHIVLEWIGQPYELQLLQKDDLATPELRALNPNGQVPILVDDGWALNENAAILNYLADKFPESKLGGEPTPRGRAEVNRWLAMINSDVHPAFKPLFGATAYLGDEAMIDKSKDVARQQLRTWYERLDKQLEGRDWLSGSRSIADPYLFVTVRWTHAVKVDLGGLGNLKAFEQRMRADPGVQRALKMQKLDQPA